MNMFNPYIKNNFSEPILVIIIFITSFFFGQLFSFLIAETLSPGIAADIDKVTFDNRFQINVLRSIQAISSIFTFIVPSLIIGKILSSNKENYLKINKTPKILYYIIIPIFMIVLMPALNLIIMWNENFKLPQYLSSFEESLKQMEISSQKMITLIISGNTSFDFLISIIIVAIIPAIGEEFLFRGVIQQQLHSLFKNIHIAIIISSFIFSAIHFQFYGFVPRMILGIIFGYIFYYSDSIWPAIFAHFFNNASALIALKVYGPQNSIANEFGTKLQDVHFVLLGLILALIFGKFLFTEQKSKS